MGILKLGGIASGLDTEGLINQLMSIERRPVNLLQQRQDKMSTEASAWRDLNTRLLNLQSRLSDLAALSSSVWSAKRVSVADQSVFTATADTTAQPGTYAINVTSLAKATTWESTRNSIADPTAALGQTGTMTVSGGPGNGKTIAVAGTDSLNGIAAKINADSTLGFTASVLQVNLGDYRLVLAGRNGAANDFSLTDSAGAVAAYLQIDAGTGLKVDTAANGAMTVNNIAFSFADNTVTTAIPGVTLSLLKPGTTTAAVSSDTQKAVDAVKAFVDQYNSVIDFIGQLTSYDPKTKKAGPLFGESLVTSIQFSLSRQVQDTVAGLPVASNALAMVGITTEKFTPGNTVTGKLVFDSVKFTAALQNDPNTIRQLFNANGASQGVAVRAQQWLQSYTQSGGLVLGQASTIDREIVDVKGRMSYLNDVILPMKEQRLREQFSNLEKAMSMFQNQGAWLSQQLSSLQK